MQGMGEKDFYFSYRMENLLFFNLTTTSPGDLIGVCVVLAVVAFTFESLKFFREYLFAYANDDGCCEGQSMSETSHLRPCGRRFSKGLRIVFHLTQAVLHMKQIFLGYIVMLCVMSFNAWFLIVSVFGLTLGYFICGAILPRYPGDSDPINLQFKNM